MDFVNARARLTESLTALEGANFSGRSELLRDWTDEDSAPGNALVGVDAHNYISGLAQTVADELDLHGLEASARRQFVHSMLATIGIDGLLSRNPLTLSGGEQVVVAMSTAILAAQNLLAIDCALEQLSPQTRATVLGVLNELGSSGFRTLVADNRLREFRHMVRMAIAPPPRASNQPPRPADLVPVRVAASSDANPIRLESIDFSYPRGARVLRDLSFDFEPGHVYLLKGQNGAGKSTLGKLLCGLLKPDRGEILDGQGALLQPWKTPGRMVGYHFQNPDTQIFSTRVANEFPPDGAAIAHAFGLEPWMQTHPYDLPFVLRKRHALAAALARRRAWMILDEPILGQDDANATCIAGMLDQAAADGSGVIVISHSEWFGGLFSRRRVLRLDGGALRAEGSD